MGEKHDQLLIDKSMRSVFVGNIPYEATEEKLKDIFCEVGPVISLKLVFDRDSGKPKGYGFCEYKDQETALSAMRNLNGYEFGGRALRVDNACTEKSRMEMAALLQGPQVDNPYGDNCEPVVAPEVITKAVATMQPDQMYELMRQAKACIQNDPAEARVMLLQNPQLTYALLQAAVVMRILDPPTAVTFLHKANEIPPVITDDGIMDIGSAHQFGPPSHGTPMDIDVRSNGGNPRASRPLPLDQDMRSVRAAAMDNFNPLARGVQPVANPFPTDPRQRPTDPRTTKDPRQQPGRVPAVNSTAAAAAAVASSGFQTNGGTSNDATDQEKAALIMQVLQLTDEQIAMLPQDQRASILVLKEQITRNATR